MDYRQQTFYFVCIQGTCTFVSAFLSECEFVVVETKQVCLESSISVRVRVSCLSLSATSTRLVYD